MQSIRWAGRMHGCRHCVAASVEPHASVRASACIFLCMRVGSVVGTDVEAVLVLLGRTHVCARELQSCACMAMFAPVRVDSCNVAVKAAARHNAMCGQCNG